jgi:hypothetical protein
MFIKKMITNFFWIIGEILILFHNKLKKNRSKNHSYEKIILGKKDMES